MSKAGRECEEVGMLFAVLMAFFTNVKTKLKANFTKVDTTTIVDPVLVAFLKVRPCVTIKVTLSSSMLTDTISTCACKGGGGLSIGGNLVVVIDILTFAIMKDCISDLMPSTAVKGFSIFVAFLLNVGFVIHPIVAAGRAVREMSTRGHTVRSIVDNVYVKFVYKFINTNNNVVVLLVLASMLKCRLGATIKADMFVVTFATFAKTTSRFIVNKGPSKLIFALYIVFALV